MRKSFRWIPVLLLALILPTANSAEIRTFTLINGQSVKATFAGLTGTQVSLVLEDGRQVTLDLNRLSQVDRSYVQSNVTGGAPKAPESTPPAPTPPARVETSPGGLKLTWIKNRIGNKIRATDKNILTMPKSETWKCQFELANTSRLRLEDLSLRYEVFLRMKSRTGQKSSTNSYTRRVTGIIKVPGLDGFRSIKLETAEIKTSGTATQVLTYDRKDRRYYDSGVRDLSMEEIEGVKVTVLQGSTEALRYVSPGMRDTVSP